MEIWVVENKVFWRMKQNTRRFKFMTRQFDFTIALLGKISRSCPPPLPSFCQWLLLYTLHTLCMADPDDCCCSYLKFKMTFIIWRNLRIFLQKKMKQDMNYFVSKSECFLSKTPPNRAHINIIQQVPIVIVVHIQFVKQ